MPEPANMKRVKLPIAGLVSGELNALVAWHPTVSFDQPLLVVLFFHGLEDDPLEAAWNGHHLPQQIAAADRNAVLIAPMMAKAGGNIDVGYLSTREQITAVVRQGLTAIGRAIGQTADWSASDFATLEHRMLLVAFSNGHRAWTKSIASLRSSSGAAPPPVIGHSLFDCLYWSTSLMEGVDQGNPPAAHFSPKAQAIVEAAFVTTHFTSGNETRTQGGFLKTMVNNAGFGWHTGMPGDLEPKHVVRIDVPTPKHLEAVSKNDGLEMVMSAVPGFAAPASATSQNVA